MSFINRIFLCFLLFSFFIPLGNAAWISPDGTQPGTAPTVKVLQSDSDHTLIDIQIPGFFVDEFKKDATVFHRIHFPGSKNSIQVGAPTVPRILENIGIPDTKNVTVREIKRDSREFKGYNLFPCQPPTTDEQPPQEMIQDEALYSSDALFPAQGVVVSEPAIWRDVRLTTLTVYPGQYHPASQRFEMAYHIVVELDYSGESMINVRTTPSDQVSPRYRKQYEHSILNYDFLDLSSKAYRDNTVKYLIITADSLLNSVAPLVDWYTQTGLRTVAIPVSTAGSTTTEIKNTINTYYTDEAVEYVLLVGEMNQIPVWSFSDGIGDYDYACLDGSDYYPEIAIGRILTTDADIVSHVIARVLNYEQNPPTDGWLSKSILAAHEEEYPGKYTQCKNQIKNYDYSIQTPEFTTYFPPEGATRPQVVAAIEEGRGLVNYRGHGGQTEWSWSPGFYNADIHGLNNGAHTPVVWNICCSNAEFDSSGECICEAWQNAGSSGEGGAVANLGATRGSYTTENHDFDKRLYRAIFDEGVTRVGDVVNLGKETMVSMGENGIYNSRIYMLFGDPAMDISTLGPGTLDVQHAPTVPIGGSTVDVTVYYQGFPVENALVCIWKGIECYETGYTNAQGQLSLPAVLVSSGFLKLTVTAHNMLPYTVDLIVEAAGCGAILLDKPVYNCSQDINIRLWDSDLNLDPNAPDQAQITISSDSEPTPETIVMTEFGNDTGEFHGSIQTSDTQSGPGYLLIHHGDSITAAYHDEDCEGSPRDVQDTATADCLGPVISNLIVSGITTEAVTITWTTDEPANTTLTWGETIPPATVTEDAAFETDHEVTLTDLSMCTDYYFKVGSADPSGNASEDDNGGAYYQFTTLQLIELLSADMSSDPGWTYEGDWAWGQPGGSGGDPSSGYTGQNVVGYNLNGAYSNSMPVYYATTLPFDCSGAAEVFLSFYKWLGVESSSYDHANVQVSVDNGASWNTVWEHTSGTQTGGAWEYVEYDISEECAGYSNVQLRWGMGPSDGSVTECGWNIDDVEVSFSTICNVPFLTFQSDSVDDSTGNNDGEINAGESIALSVTLENLGLAATGINTTLTTTNPHITIDSASSQFPDIPQSGTATSITPYHFTVSTDAVDGESIPFTLSWTSSESSGSTSFSELIVAPTLDFSSVNVLDPTGDEDGIFDPDETVQLEVALSNSGNGAAHSVSAVLTSDHPQHITIQDDTAEFPDISGGETGFCTAPYFTVISSTDIPDHTIVTFTLAISAQGYTTTETFMLEVTTSTFARRYLWSLNSDPGWDCEGDWAFGIPAGSGGDPSAGYTGQNVYGYNLSGAYSNNMQPTNLTSTAINCSTLSSVEVHFMRWLGVESSSYDHAAFQVSNDHQNWVTIWDHSGSSFTDPDWQAESYDISEVADGQATVYLRWVMGSSDSSVTYCGWNLDDIEIWAESGEPAPTHTPLPPTNTPVPPTNTPRPTNTQIPTFTAPPTVTSTPVNPTSTPVPPTSTPNPPTNTPVPTNTQIPQAGMELKMDDTDLEAGDTLHLYFFLHNPDAQQMPCDAYVLLGVYGSYWCWPSWISVESGLDYKTYSVPTENSILEEVLNLTWPADLGALDNLEFFGAIFQPGTFDLIGDVQYIKWGYR